MYNQNDGQQSTIIFIFMLKMQGCTMMINDETLGEVVAKISSMQWDVIIFSETKSSHDIIELDDGVQSHICFSIGQKIPATGVAILMHV